MKTEYDIQVLDQKIRLKSSLDQDDIDELQSYLNQVLESIRGSGQNLSTESVAILGAVRVIEDFLLRETE